MSEELNQKDTMNDVTDNDKLMALLAYALPFIVSIVILLTEAGKTRPFQRYHAVSSLVLNGGLWILFVILGCILGFILTLLTGVGAICLFPIWFVVWVISLYYGIKAYQGEYVVIPFVTDFAKGQGWIS
jgi:uncharacterized membrane protein